MFPYENRSILQIAEDIFILDDNSWHIWAQCMWNMYVCIWYLHWPEVYLKKILFLNFLLVTACRIFHSLTRNWTHTLGSESFES